MNVKIEPLSAKYVEDVARLESELIAKTSKEAVKKTLDSETTFYFVLIVENEVVGFLQCSIISPESELYEIGIDKNFQGKGYANKLMDYYLEFAKLKGCETILLEVNKMNVKAICLYKKYGFCEYGERKNYYGVNQDAVLMKLKI